MARRPLEVARAHVARKFPQLGDTRPTVRRCAAGQIFTFDAHVPVAPDGPTVRQIVRVTVDAHGQIVKVVASR
jgi:hypothetical protein